jgi:acyl-CoA synthetase (AMP-forming)/AMP-acid ligase II
MPLPGEQSKVSVWMPRLLAAGLELNPDDMALISAQGNWSWRKLDHASECYAGNLLGLGLRPGDRVASLIPNCDALIIHYLACFKAGFVATPLNYRYTPPEIDHALKTSGARVLLAHVDRDADLAASNLAHELPLGIITYGAKNGRWPSFETLLEGPIGSGILSILLPVDPAAIFFTSGSTGPAKGVTHSLETLSWMASSLAQGYQMTANDVVLSGSSISHIGAFADTIAGLGVGASIIVAQNFDGRGLLPLLRKYRPTVFIMLPAAMFELVRDPNATREDFSSIRLCSSGGDKIPLELGRELTALTGLSINEQYGMSEIGIATINPPDGLNKSGSVGRPINGFQMSIRDENGNELPLGASGRLWVKSPCNMVGYWESPEATRATIKDGWLDTGDVMKMDEEGYLWFHGRQKQIIIHDGSNISPQEVEDALMEHPAVASAGVVGVRDLVHGENVCAFVCFKQDAVKPRSQVLIDFAHARVGYKAPETIYVLDVLPINATGKVDRVELKKTAERLRGQRDGEICTSSAR